jgi:hypothetical protein
MQQQIEKIGLAFIWQNQHESNMNKLGAVIAERCNLFPTMGEISLAFQEMKHTRGKEEHTEWCGTNESNDTAWMTEEIWKPRGLRRGTKAAAFHI